MGRVWSGGIIIEINVLVENANVFLSHEQRRWRHSPGWRRGGGVGGLSYSIPVPPLRIICFIVAIGGRRMMIRTNEMAQAGLL